MSEKLSAEEMKVIVHKTLAELKLRGIDVGIIAVSSFGDVESPYYVESFGPGVAVQGLLCILDSLKP